MSPVEFYYAMEEYIERKMADSRVVYESMRLQTYYLIDIQLAKGHKLGGVTKLMKFPWDEENTKEVKQQSVEEMKRVLLGIVDNQNKRVRKVSMDKKLINRRKEK